MLNNIPRCQWADGDEKMAKYHDEVWGKPEHDDQRLFAKLCLDLMQAGLMWRTILHKQENFHKAFDGFQIKTVGYDEANTTLKSRWSIIYMAFSKRSELLIVFEQFAIICRQARTNASISLSRLRRAPSAASRPTDPWQTVNSLRPTHPAGCRYIPAAADVCALPQKRQKAHLKGA